MVINEKTFEEAPEELDCPWELEYVWSYYTELAATRQNSGMGVSPICHREITAWSDGMGYNVTPFERKALVKIDNAFIAFANSKVKTKGK